MLAPPSFAGVVGVSLTMRTLRRPVLMGRASRVSCGRCASGAGGLGGPSLRRMVGGPVGVCLCHGSGEARPGVARAGLYPSHWRSGLVTAVVDRCEKGSLGHDRFILASLVVADASNVSNPYCDERRGILFKEPSYVSHKSLLTNVTRLTHFLGPVVSRNPHRHFLLSFRGATGV